MSVLRKRSNIQTTQDLQGISHYSFLSCGKGIQYEMTRQILLLPTSTHLPRPTLNPALVMDWDPYSQGTFESLRAAATVGFN